MAPIDPDAVHPLLPTPYRFTNGTATLRVDPGRFAFTLAAATAPSEVLSAALARYRRIMFAWGSGSSPATAATTLTDCSVSVANSSDGSFQLGDDESYSLRVAADADCRLSARTVWGALRGLETLSQLVEYSPSDRWYELRKAPWQIDDKPAFVSRGVMVDTARHWLSVPALLRQIDALAYSRMNTLHWHASDEDAFPMGSTAFPALAARGSYASAVGVSAGLYSVADQEAVVQYARMRGVRVVLELDLPGHASSWALARPDLFATWRFLGQLIAEFGARFPDRVMHFGGDEVDASVRAWMREQGATDLRDGSSPSRGGATRPRPSTARRAEMAAVVRSGGRAVRSSGFYFDGGYSTGGRATVWEEVINAQLVPPGLSAEEESRVLGAEACLWGEVADELFLDQKLWLRASVLAERLWTPHATIAAYCHHKPCSFDNRDLQPRMVKNRCRLVQRGILAQPYNTQIIPDRSRWQQCELWLPQNWSRRGAAGTEAVYMY
ncbi:hypothetical protein EMIHUDRAFT_238482 [Emiliania huxleyi CCMP1516]|uniref:Beta-hexosaminidase n=2 Tax=Emiliania huxleyi TaxID=2903 RepID=A0A0D3JLQ6_EMIH1|nr:hypothetical protein EMIHUDRAFT_238482 [Emiliania huxleyi CCMP1516]EOD24441.1 hypothetical protein EMIHUDRAFT_238482 [Emiliania huxleyi CCMP1516]|eukprot:XP_005776870.1 hypothetical protein EMIHUDRAFT_238482 [Emiliania huxleyi CCMP1516]